MLIVDEYKKYGQEIQFFDLQKILRKYVVRKKNPQPIVICVKNKNLENYDRKKSQNKRADRLMAQMLKTVKYKSYISCKYFGHIQQEFKTLKTDHANYIFLK